MDILYDEKETASIRYFGLVSESNRRYDFALVYSGHFYGKVLIIDIQTGKTVIIGQDDLGETELKDTLNIAEDDFEEINDFINNLI